MRKNRIKSVIYGYETRICEIIVRGVVSRASKRETLRSVKAEILRLSLSDAEKNELWVFATVFYKHAIAGAGREVDVDERISKVYTVLRKDTPLLEKEKNSIADSIEFRKKHDDLVKMVTGDNLFYMCTSHKGCAEGHLPYQGKIYVIGDWKRRADPGIVDQVARYIQMHNTLTVEQVTAAPIWLMTRKNCTHRLVPVTTESVLDGFKGDLRHIDENRDMSYEEIQFRNYSDRLKMLQKFKDVFGEYGTVPDLMNSDLKRTRRLCRAWNEEMKKGEK